VYKVKDVIITAYYLNCILLG